MKKEKLSDEILDKAEIKQLASDMTLRQYYIGEALGGLSIAFYNGGSTALSKDSSDTGLSPHRVLARLATLIADAAIAEEKR